MWRQFRLLSLVKQIGITVLFFHALFIAVLLLDHTLGKKHQAQKKIAVRTIAPQVTPPAAIAKKMAPPLQASTFKKQEISKKTTDLKQVKKREIANKEKKNEALLQEAQRKNKTPSNEQSALLLQEIAENLDILSPPPEIKASFRKIHLPSSIPKRVHIEDEIAFDAAYGEVLGLYLQEALDLPEYGEEKAKLTIDAAGTLLSLEIIETRSKKNSEFLKKRLPELTFPCFNDFGILETVHNFTVAFTNVENP